MSKPKRGLGRGLGALIPSEPDGTDQDSSSSTEGPGTENGTVPTSGNGRAQRERPHDVFFESSGTRDDVDLVPVPGARFASIDPHSVTPNPHQPRDVFDEDAMAELIGSIKEIGVLQPIVVRPHPDGTGYELIMGERRLRATIEAGLELIPAIVRDTVDTAMLRDALVENLHRSQLNPLEEAAAYQQLLDDFGITHEQLAERISRSRPQITNTLRLLRLPPLVQRRVAAGVLSAGHARALLGLESADQMETLAQRIVAEGLSVRATEEAVTLGVEKPKPTRGQVRAGGRTAALDELGSRLGDRFDTRVKIQLGKARGKITIDFASVEDLNRIVGVLDPKDPGVLQGGADAP
ncbi:ParB/RepB/Spo0J family partition protein [Demequina aestuarii]|uniref:ParB/RepB/Spo0J family partition protein n=1 Tax=Demequina aestuarii TaxID=327095 RepID=UPI0007856FD4|nr:ParB/RepB/Spo0J family partition protein [Demequina aestuarii]